MITILKGKDITVEWVNDKMILDHVIKVDWIYEYFFAIESPIERQIKIEGLYTKSILTPIRTAIIADDTEIRIDYSSEKKRLTAAVQNGNHTVVYGEGGCGKT